jgi:aspartyl-tRNA synthetase
LTDIAKTINSNVITNSLASGGVLKGFVAKNSNGYGRKDFDRLTEIVKTQGAGGLIYISLAENIDGPINLENSSGPLNKFILKKT